MTEGLKVTAITTLQYTTSDGAKFDSVQVAIQRELKLYVNKVLTDNYVDLDDAEAVIDFMAANFEFLHHRKRQIIEEFSKLAEQLEKPGVL